jgi:hypothetical protein
MDRARFSPWFQVYPRSALIEQPLLEATKAIQNIDTAGIETRVATQLAQVCTCILVDVDEVAIIDGNVCIALDLVSA